jgi:hypothetical protein
VDGEFEAPLGALTLLAFFGSFPRFAQLGVIEGLEAAVGPPSNGYVAEDGVTNYVAEDGATFYVQE